MKRVIANNEPIALCLKYKKIMRSKHNAKSKITYYKTRGGQQKQLKMYRCEFCQTYHLANKSSQIQDFIGPREALVIPQLIQDASQQIRTDSVKFVRKVSNYQSIWTVSYRGTYYLVRYFKKTKKIDVLSVLN